MIPAVKGPRVFFQILCTRKNEGTEPQVRQCWVERCVHRKPDSKSELKQLWVTEQLLHVRKCSGGERVFSYLILVLEIRKLKFEAFDHSSRTERSGRWLSWNSNLYLSDTNVCDYSTGM